METFHRCGHEKTEENVYRYGRATQCRACRKEYAKRYHRLHPGYAAEWKRQTDYWGKLKERRGYHNGGEGDPNRLAHLMYWHLRVLMLRDKDRADAT